ncbi:MAG TPA: cytochrome P450 [Acidimicrobiales bacterium]
MAGNEAAARSGCPVEEYSTAGPRKEPLAYFRRLDELRDRSRPFFWTETEPGYYVFLDHDVIVDGLQQPDIFSSSVIVPEDPNPAYKWIPIMLDPPEHGKWRHLLASYFSPPTIKRMADEQRAFAGELIDEIAARGSCDYVVDFAHTFPTTIFLRILGAPTDMLPTFMEWEEAILRRSDDAAPDSAMNAMIQVMQYFGGLIEERRAAGGGDGNDIISTALSWEIDGEPVKQEDLLSCLLLLFMAGLDTVAAQLSYGMHHLATNPADRERLLADPSLMPSAVEEVLRTFPIVQTARKVTTDTDFHGCPVRAGDMVVFPLGSANRDEQAFPGATDFQLDRGPSRHIAFGAGPHRCLGSHLARQEMQIALEEWHRRIPSYQLDPAGQAIEHGGGVYGLDSLPLTWDVAAEP